MTSGTNPSGSCLSSKRSSKIDDNYLKELNEDLKQRKQELLDMLKPLEDKNNLLFQKLMSNLEEKQRSLQIMQQIMAGKGYDESSVMELIKEAEEMKQNLEKQQRKMEWVKYQEQANIPQNDFHGKVIELRIEALKNYQKANDLKLSLYLQQNFEPKQAFLNLPMSQEALFSEVTAR
uniref:Coiled-coil domain-containing protein 196 n=1 Tax=Castor canadensis TaxID=51338 RepID=A0A8C0XFJ3_CASCN